MVCLRLHEGGHYERCSIMVEMVFMAGVTQIVEGVARVARVDSPDSCPRDGGSIILMRPKFDGLQTCRWIFAGCTRA